MAEGRIVNKRIGLDKAVHALSSDTCRLAYTWTLPHLDRDGRVIGDPATLRSLVFPRRDDISAAQMEAFIREWVAGDLVLWYEAAGDLWLEFPSFGKNQPNLRREREPVSAIPPSTAGVPVECHCGEPPADCRQAAGELPTISREKEVRKSKEGRNTRAAAREDSPPAPEESPGGPRGPDPPPVQLTAHFARRYMDQTLRPWIPTETHNAKAAELLRECPDADQAVDRYFDEPHWFTWDRKRNKGTLSFGGFCAHAAEVLASNGHEAVRAPPARICPVCGSQVVGTMQSCGECGMEKSKFGDQEAVEEHKQWWQERSGTSRRSAQ